MLQRGFGSKPSDSYEQAAHTSPDLETPEPCDHLDGVRVGTLEAAAPRDDVLVPVVVVGGHQRVAGHLEWAGAPGGEYVLGTLNES